MYRKLNGSLTIEAAYIMAIVLICIISALKFAYWQRDQIICAYIMHEISCETAHKEPLFCEDILEEGKEHEYLRMSEISGLSGSNIDLNDENNKIETSINSNRVEKQITVSKFNPEKWMRQESVIRDYANKYINDSQKNNNQKNEEE